MTTEEELRAAVARGKHMVRRLPVIDGHKRLAGLIAIADLAAAGVETVTVQAVSVPSTRGG